MGHLASQAAAAVVVVELATTPLAVAIPTN